MNIIQYDDGKRPIYAKAINQVRSSIPSGVTHNLIHSTGYTACNDDYRAISETLRLTQASVNPKMMWLDSDVLIKKWPDFEFKPGKPYCSKKHWEAIFYVNDCCEFFKEMLYDSKRFSHRPCWLRKMFQDRKSSFEFIPEDYFIHMTFSAAILAGKNFSSYGNKDYKVYFDDKKELQFDIRF
jgi:hypothetical protein